MTVFKVVKKLSLSFFGKEWKEAYINYQAFTVRDIRDKFPQFTKMDTKNQDEVLGSINHILGLLKDKFISGKGINDEGKLVDLTKDDLEELPSEVLSRSLSFLSQGVTAPSSEPSKKSSTPKA